MIELFACLACFAVPTSAISAPPREQWLTRTARAESGNRDQAIGDHGRSRGRYQIQEATWYAHGGRRPWQRWSHDPRESARVARRILSACDRAARRRGWRPTFERIRYLYRHGGF